MNHSLSEKYKKSFKSLFPEIVEALTGSDLINSEISDASIHLKKVSHFLQKKKKIFTSCLRFQVINYNVPNGKLFHCS